MHKLLFLYFFLPFFLLTSCHKNNNESPKTLKQAERTIIIYQIAENSLGYNGYHLSDLQEIQRGTRYIPNDSQILVYTDNGHPTLSRFTNASSQADILLKFDKNLCSTNPQTLEMLLNWIKRHCPSKSYGMVLWSHASGWIPSTNTDYDYSTKSFGIDVGNNGYPSNDTTEHGNIGPQMNISDLAQAITSSDISKFDFILFDACLMQNLETIYTLREATKYIIASPISIPANGANYEHQIRFGFFASNSAQIAKTYYEDVSQDAEGDYDNFGIVVSCVRTDKIIPLAHIFQESLPHSKFAHNNNVDQENILFYQSANKNFPHNYDVYSTVCHTFSSSDIPKVLAAINELVVYKGATKKFYLRYDYTYHWQPKEIFQNVDLQNYCGVSLYIPRKGNTYLNAAFQKTAWYDATWSILKQ